MTQKSLRESEKNKLSLSLTQISIDDGLKLIDVESQPEPELKPDPKPDEVTLGASGQEIPAAGPTITPFSTDQFVITGANGAVGSYDGDLDIAYFVNEKEIKFSYSSPTYRSPYRYRISNTLEWTYSEMKDTSFAAQIQQTEGIHEYELGAARTSQVIEHAHKDTWPEWNHSLM